jgi:transmembrane protein 216
VADTAAGQRGNLTEDSGGVVVSVGLSIPAAACAVYILLFQTYVLRLEVVVVAVQLVFLILQTIFAIVAIATFAR